MHNPLLILSKRVQSLNFRLLILFFHVSLQILQRLMNYHQIFSLCIRFLSIRMVLFSLFLSFRAKRSILFEIFNSNQNDKQNNSYFLKKFELIKLLPAEELNSSLKNIETMEDTRIHFAKDNLKSFFLNIFI